MKYEKLYKSLFSISLVFNSLLSILFLSILIWSSIQKQYLSVSVTIAALTFVALFIAFIGVLLMMKRRESDVLVMWAVVLSIGRLLAVLIGAFSLMSADTFKQEDRKIEDDVIKWMEYRKLIVIAFCILYFPLFLIELFVLNRYQITSRGELKVSHQPLTPGPIEAEKPMPLISANP
ncbi:unnamed protein product, partial [Mesorhabditis belari]|uniref:Uncharacterized protein n=1 Tax=Mesorhabditis belari TaxID=2138241 RepID=A0AAF3FJE1_9BILA